MGGPEAKGNMTDSTPTSWRRVQPRIGDLPRRTVVLPKRVAATAREDDPATSDRARRMASAVADRVGAHAAGALAAQKAVFDAEARDDPSIIFGRLLEFAAAHGLTSATVDLLIGQIAKRAFL
jgi:hypothetical protein